MATKKQSPKFTAFIKYTVEVEVPISAENLECAVLDANNLTFAQVYETNYDVIDHDGLKVRGVIVA